MGRQQSLTYLTDLQAGFQYVADHHDRLPARKTITGVSSTRLHRVNHHYIAFRILAAGTVFITAVLHERMDVSTRLRDLQETTDKEVGDMRAQLLKDNLRPRD